MIEIKFKDCCNSCDELKPYSKETVGWADNEKSQCRTIFGCEHETVCGKYLHGFSVGGLETKRPEKEISTGDIVRFKQETMLIKKIVSYGDRSIPGGYVICLEGDILP